MKGAPTGRQSGSRYCSSCSRLPRSGRGPCQADHKETHGKRRSACVVEDEPKKREDETCPEGDTIRAPELDPRCDHRHPPERVLDEHQDHREPDLAGEAYLARLASDANDGILDD